MIESTGVSIEGKRAVVLGRSNIVGKPLALMLLHRNATVTICHSKTKDLPAVCREAELLLVAIGKAGWISPVPGGVGPMTIALLLDNTVESAKRMAGMK